jgi:hypothetical protein
MGPVLIGATYLLDDDEFIESLRTLAGACVVVNKPDRKDAFAAYRRRTYQLLADVNERTQGIPMKAFPALRDLAPLEGGRPAIVGPYGPAPGTGQVSTSRTLGYRQTHGRWSLPLLHAKVVLLGHLWWHDEDDGPGVADVIGFTPKRLWMSSANFTRASRRHIEIGYWTEDPKMLRGMREFLVDLVAQSEELNPDADDWEPAMAPVEYDHDAMVEALAEERAAFLDEQGRYEDWLASQRDQAD